ncbi:MAG: hypothetical protein QE493_07060 [Verrucomicrobiae bacterium]|nr:hypothetical protein [Verrucomicrobiae bacterium]
MDFLLSSKSPRAGAYSLHQPLSLALSHQPSQPLRHDQGEISGLNLLSFFVGSY